MRLRWTAVAIAFAVVWGGVLAGSTEAPSQSRAAAAAVGGRETVAETVATDLLSAFVVPAAALPGAEAAAVANPRTTWGPSLQDVADAAAAVSAMSPEELAGQVLVARYWSSDPQAAARLIRRWHLAGLILMDENIVSAAQVRATAAAVHQAVARDGRGWPAVVAVDQEGGRVARLGDLVSRLPAFAAFGAAGPGVTETRFRRLGTELAALGITMDFAPVADVTVGSADPTIGDRSAATDAAVVSVTARAAARGLLDGGVVPVVKHFPGHGSVTADSHIELPLQSASLSALEARDLIPFRDAVSAGAPVVMVGHLDVPALESGVPSSLSPATYRYLREELGFAGVAVTDSLTMGAIPHRNGAEAVRALAAGADLVLMPYDIGSAHAAIVAALASGDLPRERVEEAAARVVALQLWLAAR